MASYISHNYWRVRFIAGEGDVYSLRNIQFRRFSASDPVNPCGTVEECRAGVEAGLLYNEQAEGTRAADLFLYSNEAFDPGWVSLDHVGGLPTNVYVGRQYAQGRDVAFLGLIAAVGDAPATRISRFVVEYSDNGVDWIESREFTTNPVWGRGETRVFALPSADASLPVFTFRPNRKEPLSENLAFLTDVLKGARGAEQRRSLRPTPRRTFETDFLLTGRERTFWDLFANRLAGGEVMVPLYWEVVTTPANLLVGNTDRINFDTTNREWRSMDGELALLAGPSALDYEVIQIADVDDDGIDLAVPVANSWPKGTKLFPLRRGVLDEASEPSHKSAGVATVTARLRITVENPWTPAADTSPVYLGLPVFLDEPNWVDDLTVEYAREIASLDPGTGLPFQVDRMGRALVGQAHRWFLTGRQRLAKFRDLIYRHRGRAGSFWLPTFKADLTLVSPVAAAGTQITVENVGYLYTGGPTSGREYIAIKHDGGTILRKVLSVIPGTTKATERVNLDAAVGLDLSPGQVRRISFADVARFDTDEFEIVHHGGIDGHHSASATFRTFKNTRTAPQPIAYPIPVSEMNEDVCGFVENHAYWRVVFLAASGDRYAVRNVQFRRNFGDTGTTPCGTLAQCRDSIQPQMLYSEQGFGTIAADAQIYNIDLYGWSSNAYSQPLPEKFLGRHYSVTRPVGVIGIIANADTSITRLAVEWSDDGANWTRMRTFNTSGEWEAGETRTFLL